MMSLLSLPSGRAVSSSFEVLSERIVTMTVVAGRRSSEAVSPKPIPVGWFSE